MERRPLNFPELVRASRENVVETYIGLAAPVAGCQIERGARCSMCTGPSEFSFCNFAAGFNLADDRAEALRQLEAIRAQIAHPRNFWAFLITGDRPQGLPALLDKAGFAPRHSLVEMAWRPAFVPDGAPLTLATTPEDRIAVAEFMTLQFFWRMAPSSRRRIAEATAGSPHELYRVGPQDRCRAGVMLCRTAGAVGLYNLCVEEKDRGRGMGSSVVRSVKRMAAADGKPVVLQCEPALVPWYIDQGFEEIGTVTAYCVVSTSRSDILGGRE